MAAEFECAHDRFFVSSPCFSRSHFCASAILLGHKQNTQNKKTKGGRFPDLVRALHHEQDHAIRGPAEHSLVWLSWRSVGFHHARGARQYNVHDQGCSLRLSVRAAGSSFSSFSSFSFLHALSFVVASVSFCSAAWQPFFFTVVRAVAVLLFSSFFLHSNNSASFLDGKLIDTANPRTTSSSSSSTSSSSDISGGGAQPKPCAGVQGTTIVVLSAFFFALSAVISARPPGGGCWSIFPLPCFS